MPDLARYGFEPHHQQLYEQVDRYAREQLHPLAARMDAEDWFPESEFRALSRIGLFGITAPEEYGGAGLDTVAQMLAAEALSHWNSSIGASYLASDNLCLNNILRNAGDELRNKYLPGMCSGALIGALALTEPGAGSDALGSMATRAERRGDHYVLNGRKMFITNGPVADIVLVYAKTDASRGAQGISAFVVESGFSGYSVAQKLDKMGWRGSPTGELVFDDCIVPAENVVGGENRGVAVVMSGLDIERVAVSAHALGVAQRALNLSIQQAGQREQFGKAIGTFQLVQAMLADMYTEIETIRCLTYQLMKEIGGLEAGEGGRGEIHARTAACLLHAGRACMRVLDAGVQLFGGGGFMCESEINRLYRLGKVLEIGAGTNQVRQLIIGEELLRANRS